MANIFPDCADEVSNEMAIQFVGYRRRLKVVNSGHTSSPGSLGRSISIATVVRSTTTVESPLDKRFGPLSSRHCLEYIHALTANVGVGTGLVSMTA